MFSWLTNNFDQFPKTISESQAYVVWSGGADSTLLLHQLAKKFGKSDKPVIAISFDHYMLGEDKLEKERESRKRIKEKFKGQNLFIEFQEVLITGQLWPNSYNRGLPQANLWASMVTSYVNEDAHIFFGYIRHDDIWHFFSEFQDHLNSACKLLRRKMNFHYPFQWTTKAEIIFELYIRELYDIVWYCERPDVGLNVNGHPCGRCSSCESHRKALLELWHMEKHDWAKEIFDKLTEPERRQLEILEKERIGELELTKAN